MTEFIKKKEVKKNWYKIDATNLIVGRLASEITKILRGKKKTSFTPNMDDGDFVIVTNARKLKFTGKKFSKKSITNILAIQVVLKKLLQIKFLKKILLELLN
jgi:large subunit ribosomal protein L13